MASNEALKSPLEHVWRQIIPQGHDQALKNAFYNVAAAIFVIGAGAAAWSVYLILQPFVQALLWAVLCGSVLYPLKFRVSNSVRRWLSGVQQTKSLLSLSVALLPVTSLDNLSEYIGWYVMEHVRVVVGVTVVLPLVFLVIHHTPSFVSRFAVFVVTSCYSAVRFCLDAVELARYPILLLLLVYLGTVVFGLSAHNRVFLKRLNGPALLAACALLSVVLPAGRVFVFLALASLLVAGAFSEVVDQLLRSPDGKVTLVGACQILGHMYDDGAPEKLQPMEGPVNSNEEEASKSESEVQSGEKHGRIPDSESSTKCSEGKTVTDSRPSVKFPECEVDEGTPRRAGLSPCEPEPASCDMYPSSLYLKIVFLACVLVELWRHRFLLTLLPLAIGYYIVKKGTSYHLFGDGILKGKMVRVQKSAHSALQEWLKVRQDILIPLPLLGVFKLLKKTDRRIVAILSDSVDTAVTIVIILAFIVSVAVTTIFIAVQIQGEGMQLVTIGSRVVNASIVNNPQLLELLPDDIGGVVSEALDTGYVHGREWLAKTVRSLLGEVNETKAAQLESQVLDLWDRVYQAWIISSPPSPFEGPAVTSAAVAVTFDSLLDGLLKTPGLISISTISDVMRENIGTIVNVVDGVWTIVVSNLSLLVSATSTSFSLILGSSLSILNGLLNLVVFFSALFYVVSISGDVYKPVALLSSLAPGQMNSIGVAVTDSVNGVFIASMKMGAFYGMWTWLLHSLFSTNVVYIPAVLGAVFGAVPLLGTYWAAVPGALELAWLHGSPFMAVFLLVAQMLPMSCVDTAVYSEIKGGGHPYLTGLAVAGGIFCWGVQGAIFGPLLLCILLVVTKIYASLIQPSDYPHPTKKFRRNLTIM